MKPRKYISLIGRIREAANKFIVDEMNNRGLEGLVPSHGSVLHELYRSGSLPLSEISARIRRSQPTVTVLVDKLVRQGYATKERDTNDSRITLLTLTQKGREAKPLIDEISQVLFMKLGRGLSESELDVFESVLYRILENS